jgi:hypothetical protein
MARADALNGYRLRFDPNPSRRGTCPQQFLKGEGDGMILVKSNLLVTAMVAALAVCRGGTLVAIELPDNIQEITRDLELMGYKVEQGEKVLYVKRSNDSMKITKHRSGLLVVVSFGGSDVSRSHRGEFLEFVNRLNADAVALRVYISKDGNVHFEGWFADEYERVRFGVFLEAWNNDVKRLINQNQTAAQRFLR